MSQLPNTAKVSEIIASLQDSTAVNVRPDLAQRIGSPALGTDAMSTMLDKFDTIRTNMINDLKAKGYTLTGNESIADLEAIVKGANLVNTTTANGATAAQVLVGREGFANGAKIAGTMPDRGAVTINPWSYDQAIPAGYHSGAGKVPAVVVPVANVLAGTTIANQAGTMPDKRRVGEQGYITALSVLGDGGGSLVMEPPTGYYQQGKNAAGFGSLISVDPDFVAANILSGKNIFGVTGTLVKGRPVAYGTMTANGGNNLIAGLSFAPVVGFYKQLGGQWGIAFFSKNWSTTNELFVNYSGSYTGQAAWDSNNGLTADGMMTNNIQMGSPFEWYCIGA